MTPPDASFALPFAPEDLRLLSLNALSVHLRASRAFVRLCLACGCPTRGGRLSAAELLHWLFGNYPKVRKAAGLAAFRSVDLTPRAGRVRLRMANAVITLTEFNISRCSVRRHKRLMRKVIRILKTAVGKEG